MGFIALALSLAAPAQAIEFNLFKLDNSGNTSPTGTPQDANNYARMLSSGYGFPQQQVAPAMMGPAEQTPTILRIAQAAGTLPVTIFAMRQMGLSYSKILSIYALSPNILATPGYGPINNYNDNTFISLGQRYFLQRVLGVPQTYVSQFPFGGYSFVERILRPYDPVTQKQWLPPGIAMKYGLWTPPGQAKKGNFGHPGHSKGHWKGYPGYGNGAHPGNFKAKGHSGHGKVKVQGNKSHGHKNHYQASSKVKQNKGGGGKAHSKSGGKGKNK